MITVTLHTEPPAHTAEEVLGAVKTLLNYERWLVIDTGKPTWRYRALLSILKEIKEVAHEE
jgi:hypothetical protein